MALEAYVPASLSTCVPGACSGPLPSPLCVGSGFGPTVPQKMPVEGRLVPTAPQGSAPASSGQGLPGLSEEERVLGCVLPAVPCLCS